MSSLPPQHNRYPPIPTHNDRRLPSLKDLNFQYRPLSHQDPQSVDPPTQDYPVRHQWTRPNGQLSLSPHQPQHSPPTPHPPKPIDYTSKPDNAGYLTPGMPLSAQITPVQGAVNTGPAIRGDELSHSQNSLKRPRTSSSTSVVSDGHPQPSHAPYPPQYATYPSPQPPPPPFHPVQTGPPPSHEQMHHPGPGPSSHPGYAYQQPYMQQRHPHPHPYPHSHPPHIQHPPPPPPANPYPPSDQWNHHHPPPPHHHQPSQPPPPPPQPQQQPHQPTPPPPPPPPPQTAAAQSMAFSRTTPIVPTNVDARTPQFSSSDASSRDSTVSEIMRHCTALYSFATRYAQLQASMPNVQPLPAELTAMTQRASQVVRLLEGLRRSALPEADRLKLDAAGLNSDDYRPPKRPWEDLSHEGAEAFVESYASGVDKAQTTAEQDMEIIRTKRATSTAAGGPAAVLPKSKYRKRSRATPPGKCHSCNIRETPEWRRGPDGARTLCNACGLHYAKLMRKRDKTLVSGTNDAPRIDMDTLRASARANEVIVDNQNRASKPQSQSPSQADGSMSPGDHGKHLPQPAQATQQQQHQGSFQVVSVMASGPSAPPPGSDISTRVHGPPGVVPPPPNSAMPTPPWATTPVVNGGRGYAPDQLQHQSFIRTSNGASPG